MLNRIFESYIIIFSVPLLMTLGICMDLSNVSADVGSVLKSVALTLIMIYFLFVFRTEKNENKKEVSGLVEKIKDNIFLVILAFGIASISLLLFKIGGGYLHIFLNIILTIFFLKNSFYKKNMGK